MFNHAFALDKMEGPSQRGPASRKRVRSSPRLLQRLPSTGLWSTPDHRAAVYLHLNHIGVLERDAEEEIPRLMLRQLRHSPSPPPEPQTPEETPSEPPSPTTPTTPRSPIIGKNPFSRKLSHPKPAPVRGKLWEGTEPQVRSPQGQLNLSKLTLSVMGGI